MVKPGLRGLGNAVHDLDLRRQLHLGFADHAGKHDGQQAGTGIAGALGEQALDFHAAQGAMVEIARQLLLLGAGASAEAAAAGAANLQRREVGEHAQHPRHLGVQGTAVADGEVQGEVVRARPGSQNFGVGGEQQVRGRQSGSGGAGFERVPDRRRRGGHDGGRSAHRPGAKGRPPGAGRGPGAACPAAPANRRAPARRQGTERCRCRT